MSRLLGNLNPLTEYAILFISLIGVWFQVRWTRRGSTLGPTLLTTLGIFFCFLGIAFGLSDFDPNDVRVSVPHLLQGIRTSFWASVTGIGWALLIKLRLVLFGEAPLASSGPADNTTIDDLASELVRLNSRVGAEPDSSLLGELRLIRTDSNQRLDHLTQALDAHAHRTAEMSARVLVEALSVVVRDFNSALVGQFGENFKQLDLAVGRLVTWLTEYEHQLDAAIERERAAAQYMSDASSKYVSLVDSSKIFVDTAGSLHALLSSLNIERERFDVQLRSFVALIEKASDGLPRLEENIVEMTNQIARGVQTNQEALGNVLKSSWQSIQVHNQYLSAMLAKSLDTANKDIANHARQLGERARAVAEA
jgi:hypothetical protein